MSNRKKNIDFKSNEAHDNEHTQWSRRAFLQTLGIGCAGGVMLGGNYVSAAVTKPLMMALNELENDRVLVLIRLKGGNDGLNTIVPLYDFDTYANARPSIYHNENDLIKLNDNFGIPNFMESLESMWGDGKMKVVHGVGYDDQSRSHFTGSDIIATSAVGTDVIDYNKGWIGSYYNENYPDFVENPPEKPLAIQIGSSGDLTFSYEEKQYAYLVANPEQLESIAQSGTQFNVNDIDVDCKIGQQQSFLRTNANNTFKYAEVIHEAYENSTNAVEYTSNSIADQLAIVARLIKGNLGTKIYLVTLDGFDTHSGQQETHQTLLTDLSDAIKNFYTDLEDTGHDQNVLGMTFSEFGRRVAENGSGGTDHGLAAPAFLFGPELNGSGFLGEHPSLSDLERDSDLKYSTDFRALYETVLLEWLCADESETENALFGYSGDGLDLGFACETSLSTPTTVKENILPFRVYVAHNDGETFLNINSNIKQDVTIRVYDMNGQYIGEVLNETLNQASYKLNVKTALNRNISNGYYIYKVLSGGNISSNKMLIL